jgi:asparagine synthase (glutamine-hydrolysing)
VCGIAGLWTPRALPEGELVAQTEALRDTLTHRGPDSAGTWVDARVGLGLGHRRLAIVDLSPTGHQPMVSRSGRYVITFNGEVYNFARLRAELEGFGHSFRGHSDTEVMLAAFERWGVEPAIERFVGMFAFALWDAADRHLWLVRDRLGIKPLYYGRVGDALVFGSELKALVAMPGFDRTVDRESLAAFLRYNNVPAPHTIWKGVYKLMPGTLLRVDDPAGELHPREWWSAVEVATHGRSHPFDGTDAEAIDGLHERLLDAVRLRMLADVPLGAFLSGGIDSSTVVALMQAQSSQRVRTFSIGYREGAYDETHHARAVAEHLGTDHTELVVTPEDALATIPSLATWYDEPFSDSSQIPTMLVSKLARPHVTVALSGDGGDELFAGYNRHLWAPRIWDRMSGVPAGLRRRVGDWVHRVPPAWVDAAFAGAGPALPPRLRFRVPGEKLHKLGAILGSTDEDAMYRAVCSHTLDPLSLAIADGEHRSGMADLGAQRLPFAERMMLLDLRTYLPDDILTKVDRASMAFALEARVPLLDHRVVAYAWTLPARMRIRDGETKWVLRRVLERYVPRALFDREKSGFGVPVAARAAPRLGRGAPRARPAAPRRVPAGRAGSPPVGRAPRRPHLRAPRAVGPADVSSLARALGTLTGARRCAPPIMDPYQTERERMVEQTVQSRGVLRAMRAVERHRFVPPEQLARAYDDAPLPIGFQATISQPYVVAWMVELAGVRAGHRVLDVGTGSGYQAAVLAALGAEVYTIERVPELVVRAERTLAEVGAGDVHCRLGDGRLGWPEHAPFDAILVAAAAEHVPRVLLEQLAPGGRLVLPIGSDHHQELLVLEKTPWGAIRRTSHGAVAFVPLI